MPVIRVGEAQLRAEIEGPTHAPVVAFSNSLGATAAMWDGVVPHLRGRYRVLRYDTRGHGGSETLDRATSIQDLAGDLVGLLDALGVARAHIVGLSLGGMTGQALAAAHPDRVASLTLMATTAGYGAATASWHERAALVRREGPGALAEATMGRWFTQGFLKAEPERVARIRDELAAIDREGYARCCEAIADMDLRGDLPRITAPTLILAGRDDPATPVAMMEEIAGLIRDAELVVLPRAAHLLATERPDATASHLLAFLDRHREAGAPSGATVFEAGLANRRAVLGAEHVDRSLAKAGGFAGPWQDFITRAAWGEVWGDPRLPWKTRSLVTLAMMVALHREEEFKLHVRPALRNGVSVDELQALLLQSAIYAGVPAANAAFRWAREVLGDELA